MSKIKDPNNPFHPFANFFPLTEGEELKTLAEDIRENKQQNPIIIYNGKILDGRNRYRACKWFGLEPKFKEFKGTESEALNLVVSMNITRRHSTVAQRAVIAVRILPFEQEKAIERMLMGKKDPTQNIGEGQVGEAIEIVARKVRVSSETVRQAATLVKAAPEVLDAIEAGIIKSMPEALKIASLAEPLKKDVIKYIRETGCKYKKAMTILEKRNVVKQDEKTDDKADLLKNKLLGDWDKLKHSLLRAATIPYIPTDELSEVRNELKKIIDLRQNRPGVHFPNRPQNFIVIPGVVPYLGGKFNAVNDILRLCQAMIKQSGLGDNFEFWEPFFGGGSISINILANNLAPKIKINERNLPLCTLVTKLIKDPTQLIQKIKSLRLTQDMARSLISLLDPKKGGYHEVLNRAYIDSEPDINQPILEIPGIQKALDNLVIAKLVAQKCGIYGHGEMMPNGGIPKNALARWDPEKISEHFLLLHSIFKDRVVDNCCQRRPFDDFLDDVADCFIFADPPYYESGEASYVYSFHDRDHDKLELSLTETTSPFLLTYDDHPYIRKLYGRYGFHYIQPIERKYAKKIGKELWIVRKEFQSIMEGIEFENVRKVKE